MLQGINHITIAVSNLDRSLAFYAELLGMKAHVRWDTGAYLSLADMWFCLSFDTPIPNQDYSHIALTIAEKDFTAFATRLRKKGVIEWKQNSSEGQSIYFLDPDGYKLELHCGNLQSRLTALAQQPYSGLIWL